MTTRRTLPEVRSGPFGIPTQRAENGTADRIVLTSGGSYAWWNHETGETAPVVVIWNE